MTLRRQISFTLAILCAGVGAGGIAGTAPVNAQSLLEAFGNVAGTHLSQKAEGEAPAETGGTDAPAAPSADDQPVPPAPEGAIVPDAPAGETGAAPAAPPTPAPVPATNGADSAAPASGSEKAPAPAEGKPVVTPEQAAADQLAIEEVRQPAVYLKAAVDLLEQEVEAASSSDDNLAKLRVEIDAVIGGGDLFLESLQPRYKAVTAQIAKLGPPPEKDQPAEAPAIAAERARLTRLSAEIDGAIKATGLVQYRARSLLTRVQELRTGLFTSQLLRRNSSPLSPETWSNVAGAMPGAISELRWSSWRLKRVVDENLWSIIAIAAGSIAFYFGLAHVRRRIFAARLEAPRETEPDFFQRAGTAGWVASLYVLPAALAMTLLCFGLDAVGFWFLDSERLVVTVLPAALVFIGVRALARAILQPNRPQWRLVDLADQPAASLATAMTLIGAVYAADVLLREAVRVLAMPLSVSVAVAALASVGLAALLFKIVRTRFVPRPPVEREPDQPSDALTAVPREAEGGSPVPEQVSLLAPRILKIPLLIVALFILLASLSGYVALGRFAAGQVIVTGSLVVLVILLHLAIRALVGEEAREDRALGRVMHQRLGLDDGQSRSLTKAAGLLLDGLLALVALPFIMATWGFALPDTLAWLKSLVFGFEIGHVRISLAQIAAAIGIFLGLLFVTRQIQRWINSSFLQTARIDPGVANSIHKAIGYAGFALALLAALSYSGLDITNLAIVAGALSVGIGFGLQSIVNNFVSGLILLIERPVKVGDLVVVNGQWGRVRNIAVRSTEIETADRASLIVPNSELISTTVTNWTHRNALSRVTIRVSTGYDSDPDHVRAVLEKCASECQIILQQPRPEVVFENFGASGLDFALHTVVPDIARGFAAQTDLRTRIIKAFRSEGIEVPYNQVDVNLRDLDFLRTMFAKAQQAQALSQVNVGDAAPSNDGVPPKPAGGGAA